VVGAVRRIAERSPRDAAFVGIDGLGGSGKTTLAEAIRAAVPRSVVVPTDDFQGEGIAEWDWPRMRRDVVAPLLAGRAAEYEIRWWGETIGRGWRTVPVDAVVIIEGVSATRSEFEVPWALTVWVDAEVAVRRRRIAGRDGLSTAKTWRLHWWPSEQNYISRERPQERVDLIVTGIE
jgi:uridine kinase